MLENYKYEAALRNLLEAAIFLQEIMPRTTQNIVQIAQDVSKEMQGKQQQQQKSEELTEEQKEMKESLRGKVKEWKEGV